MINLIKKLCLIAGVFFTTVLVVQPALATIIRDAELEAGFQQLAAPLREAAGFTEEQINIRIVIDPSFNAFVTNEMTICINQLVVGKVTRGNTGVIAHELGHLKLDIYHGVKKA